ncbi:hypothetical protein BH20ACI1_BH20ACI1_14070 [soil metagenome]
MFCPKCANEINSNETKFCSNCGSTIKSVRQSVIENGANEGEISQFQKGLRFGAKLLLLALILLPVLQILSGFFPPDDKLVESSPSSTWFDFFGNAVLIALTLSGIARIFYAFVFERSTKSNTSENFSKSGISDEEAMKKISGSERDALPPSQSIPVSNFGNWRTTDELFEPIFSKPKTSGELK